MTEAPKEEAKAKDSQVFMIEGELRDAWGRPAEADEAVDLSESKYASMKVDELKSELKDREDAGRSFDKGSIKTKRDLVAALEADDRAQAEEAADNDQE